MRTLHIFFHGKDNAQNYTQRFSTNYDCTDFKGSVPTQTAHVELLTIVYIILF